MKKMTQDEFEKAIENWKYAELKNDIESSWNYPLKFTGYEFDELTINNCFIESRRGMIPGGFINEIVFENCSIKHIIDNRETKCTHLTFKNSNIDRSFIESALGRLWFLNICFTFDTIEKSCPDLHEDLCPKEGEFTGYKAGMYLLKKNEKKKEKVKVKPCIIKLLVPSGSKRLTAFQSNKCRCDKAKVLGFYDLDGSELTKVRRATGIVYSTTDYIKGHVAEADLYEEDAMIECSHGIHFFMSFNEAVTFYLETGIASF